LNTWPAASSSAMPAEPDSRFPAPSLSLPSRPRGASKKRRPRLLEVEFEDITVNAGVFRTGLAWYEVARCFVSLHPSSARVPQNAAEVLGFLPVEVPLETQEWQHLVSQLAMLRSGGSLASAATGAVSAPGDVAGSSLRAQLDEKASLRMDRPHSHCIAFLWCRRGSMVPGLSNEDVALLGWRAIPLRDESLHGRLAAWDFAHAETGEQVAVLRMRCSVATPPGAIQLPHLEESAPTCVRFHWSIPLADGGKPILGYQVSLLEPCSEDWVTLSECAPSTTFVVRNLTPGTAYLLDVKPVNDVGVGDGCELEVVTVDDHQESEEETEYAKVEL